MKYTTFTVALGEEGNETILVGVCLAASEQQVRRSAVSGQVHPDWIADIPDGHSDDGKRKAQLILDALNSRSND